MTRPCPNCDGSSWVTIGRGSVACSSCRGTGKEPLRDVTGPDETDLEASRYRHALHHIDETAVRGLLLKTPTETLSTIRSLVKRALENLQ